MDQNNFGDEQAKVAGLTKLEAYVPTSYLLGMSVQSKLGNAPQLSVPIGGEQHEPNSEATPGKKEAERAAHKRLKLAESGLKEIIVVINDIPEIRDAFRDLAKRTISMGWENAVAVDQTVRKIKSELDRARNQLRRNEDLDARHRQARRYIDYCFDLRFATGLKRGLLILAGVLPELDRLDANKPEE